VDGTPSVARVAAMDRILMVDDDAHIREVVCFALRRVGYQTLQAANGLEALEIAARERPALIILDILMPELDGTAACARLRRSSDVPVIFLTSKDEEVDRILGLELGADDYVVKPFSPGELVARVKAVLRRKGTGPSSESKRIVCGKLAIDIEAHSASWDGADVALTATEFALLKTIAAQPRRAFSRDNLMSASYVGARFVSDRTIDSHVRHIRTKFQALGGDPIETVHGVGYRLAAS
jgi:two-component system OmpR family response regulator